MTGFLVALVCLVIVGVLRARGVRRKAAQRSEAVPSVVVAANSQGRGGPGYRLRGSRGGM